MDEGTGMTMAQPSSVQREPSMEEILASIRRIIEDNESSRKDEKPVQTQEPLRAADAEVNVPATPAPAVAESQPQPASGPSEFSRPLPQAVKTAELANDIVSLRPAPKPVTGDAGAGSDRAAFNGADGVSRAAGIAAAEEAETRVREETMVQVSESVPPASAASGPAPILSEQSERKVAMAFSELSEAYQAVRRKSLADAVEDMLRPMLRDWLDENLPQLVERLVREEIERIARGG